MNIFGNNNLKYKNRFRHKMLDEGIKVYFNKKKYLNYAWINMRILRKNRFWSE